MRLLELRDRSQTLRPLEERAEATRLRHHAIEDHMEILAALGRSDPQTARSAMERHLSNSVELLAADAGNDVDGSSPDAASRMRLRMSRK